MRRPSARYKPDTLRLRERRGGGTGLDLKKAVHVGFGKSFLLLELAYVCICVCVCNAVLLFCIRYGGYGVKVIRNIALPVARLATKTATGDAILIR